MRNILTIVFILYCPFLFSQYDVDVTGNDPMVNTSGLWIIQNNIKSNIKGSCLLFKESNNISVVTTDDGKLIKVKNLNYNIREDNMQTKLSADSVFIFNANNIKTIHINNRLFKQFINPESSLHSFYEVVASCREMDLLKKHSVTVKEGVINPLTQQKQSPDTYIKKFKYFLYSNNSMQEITLKKSKILKLFKQKGENIKNYVTENNLSFKSESDLKLLFKYYDTLLSI